MPWFKVDDSLESHPKIKAIPRPRRLKAMGLWVLAGSWSASQLTDGFVPNYMISELSATKREATTLVEVGLWTATEGGYVFKDWHDWQPTKAVVEAGREAARERMRVARERKKGSGSGDVRANTSEAPPNGSGEVRSTPRSLAPTRPDPTRPDPKEEQAGKPATRSTQFPKNFEPNDTNRRIAVEKNLDLDAVIEQWSDHHIAKGSKFVDWNRALNTWLRNERPAAPTSKPRNLPNVHDLERPPDGLSPDEYAAWEYERRQKRGRA